MSNVMSAPASLRLEQLRKTYGKVVAVDGIDLVAYEGECLGLLGPNGAGKTTTIEICEGLTAPDSGRVELLGLDWTRHGLDLRRRIGVQLQETQLSDKLTVKETVELFRSFYPTGPTVAELIERVELGEKRSARVSELSGGQKQRLSLACAMAGDPALVFLDEPTTGLDPQARRQVWTLVEELKNAGRTVILTTHYMEEAERLCGRIAIMDHGRIIASGTPGELIQSLGVGHVIQFGLREKDAPLELSALQSLDGVCRVRQENGRYELSVTELHRSIPALFAELGRRGVVMQELRTHSASLDDVFVSLTGRQLRDE
jgi:ABC-2 type transport system ATP-binding protein